MGSSRVSFHLFTNLTLFIGAYDGPGPVPDGGSSGERAGWLARVLELTAVGGSRQACEQGNP